MLKCTNESLLAEIREAEKVRKPRWKVMDALVASYAKSSYTTSESAGSPENHVFEYVSLVLPRICSDNYRAMVTSRRGGIHEDVAMGIQYGLNTWSRDERVSETLELIGMDFLFMEGAALIGRRQSTGKNIGDGAQWPTFQRIAPKRFGTDPIVDSWDDGRFEYHMWVRPKHEILEEAEQDPESGWDVGIVSGLTTDSFTDELGRDRDATPPGESERDEIVGYDIWVKHKQIDGFRPEDGFNGTIYTVIPTLDGEKFARAPRPYFGPRWGPYAKFQAYPVPGKSVAMSPLAATRRQQDDAAKIAKAMSASATAYKRMVFVDAANPELAKIVRDRPHDFVFSVNGFKKDEIVEVSIGGVPQELVVAYQLSRERLMRISGISDAQSGNVTGRGSATENAIADEATTNRMGKLKKSFMRGVRQSFRTVAWDFYHNEHIAFLLGEQEKNEMGIPPGKLAWFGGGPGDGIGPDDMDFDSLDLEIEPYSTARTTDEEVRDQAMNELQLVQSIAPLIPQLPWVDWNLVFKRLGRAVGNPDFSRMVNVAMAMEMAMPGMPPATVPEPTKIEVNGQSGQSQSRPALGGSQWGGARGPGTDLATLAKPGTNGATGAQRPTPGRTTANNGQKTGAKAYA